MEIYLVGGAVRDRLLHLPVAERDWVVVGATADEMLALGYTPVGKNFPVFLHPETKEEYALARTERKRGHGYTGFEIFAEPDVTLEQDLMRRDLTINAMAEDKTGRLIDPYGGEEDLANGLLRHVSPAFAEDPVRILRVARLAARFAEYGFRVAHGTNKLMREMVANGEVEYLVAERVWAELSKALETRTPVRFFDVLNGCHALQALFPRLASHYAGEDAHTHDSSLMPVLAAASAISNDSVVRFAALACDMNHAGDWLDLFCDRYRIPNSYRELAAMALRYRKRIHDIEGHSANDLFELLTALDAFRRPDRLGEFLLVCEADARAGSPDMPDYPQATRMQQALVAAQDVRVETGNISGREIGEAIRQARIEAIGKTLAI